MKMNLETARAKIENALENRGDFTHNIVGMILKDVAKTHGFPVANKLIDDLDLHKEFGIRKVQ